MEEKSESKEIWKTCILIFLYIAQMVLFMTTDILVIIFYTSADSYCEKTYDVSTNFFSFSDDCIGDIYGCNADDRCYTTGEGTQTGSYFGPYCNDFCGCCPKESFYAYMLACSILLGITGVTHLAGCLAVTCSCECLECCKKEEDDPAQIACLAVLGFLGHFVTFIIIACDKEFQVSQASTVYTMVVIALSTAGFELLLCVCLIGIALREEDEKSMPGGSGHTTNFIGASGGTDGEKQSGIRTPSDSGDEADEPDVKQAKGNKELLEFLKRNEEECLEMLDVVNLDQVCGMIDKLEVSNEANYDILISEFQSMNDDREGFFKLLKNLLQPYTNNTETNVEMTNE